MSNCMNCYLLIWSVCTFVESLVQEEILMEELVCQTDRMDENP